MSTQTANYVDGIPVHEILPGAKLIGAPSLNVSSCCGQWDECQPGDLYVAILGAETDGHDYCPQAIENGATAVITERLVATTSPQVLVPDSRQAYAQICHALAGSPCERMSTIGVSGSAGKTVTTHLVQSILKSAGRKTGRSSSLGTVVGNRVPTIPHRELNPPLLAEQMSQMVINGCTHAVVEVSARNLAKRKFEGAALDVAVLTNMRDDDLDFHSTRENFKRSQLRILDSLKPTGLAVLNLDDPTSHFLVESCTQPVLTFGMHQDANVRGQLLERLSSEQSFLLVTGSESVAIRTAIIGDEHIYNCLCAATVGLALGIDLQSIAEGLENGSQLPGRMERIECGQDHGVWIDTAKTPVQLATALRTLKQVVKGNVWCVCSIVDEQSREHRRRIGEVLDRAADNVVVTRDSVDSMIDYEPMHQMFDGFEEPNKVRLIPNRFRAIEWALGQARPNDAVLIAGCGEKPFALLGDENWTIADRDVCEAWLFDNASIDGQFTSPDIFRIDDYR
ncbi:Mur ligase family protein [Mariniblastus fucicola]|uniref:UDP-N-acetylmuramoyl-L-alanyl-D-glutamate--LD-lysine ligase n=1 Tax=Mariniblastus fucicola TaxID=980251 RepID=A0A5B9P7B8_9BACT|nr:UDP-N-acetylmuramyl-tripeptide synthetase [Mariniblastus fucicola]QEG22537.1 UDP-N-acetylmuramoyl-L-alanyl-D-glutamate--LD-lysine ligase [Mariniblastus fucicola]